MFWHSKRVEADSSRRTRERQSLRFPWWMMRRRPKGGGGGALSNGDVVEVKVKGDGQKRSRGGVYVTRIVNKTGRPLVLQSKHRDIWEGPAYPLDPPAPPSAGGSRPDQQAATRTLFWDPEVYNRLGCLLAEPQPPSCPVYISRQKFLDSAQIDIVLSPSSSSSARLQFQFTSRNAHGAHAHAA